MKEKKIVLKKILSKSEKEYHRQWMKKHRSRKRKERIEKGLVTHGHCPLCGMFLRPQYEKYHKGCPYYDRMINARIHAKIQISK